MDAPSPDATLAETCRRAVRPIVRDGEGPEVVIKALRLHRSVVYQGLGPKEMRRLVRFTTSKNPVHRRFPLAPWRRSMIQELIWPELGVRLSESVVGRLLQRLGSSPPTGPAPDRPAGLGSGAAMAGRGLPRHPEAGPAGRCGDLLRG